MNNLIVSFSLKPLKEAGRTFEDAILPVLEDIHQKYPSSTLHHGFLERHVLEERGLPTNVVDALDRLWPDQVRHSSGGQLDREQMAHGAKEFGAKVFAIGPIVEGVAEEVAAYMAEGVTVSELDWA